jgi:hypothetical protein
MKTLIGFIGAFIIGLASSSKYPIADGQGLYMWRIVGLVLAVILWSELWDWIYDNWSGLWHYIINLFKRK